MIILTAKKIYFDAPFITQLSFDCKPTAHFVQLNCKVERLTINLMWFKRANPLQNFGGSTILKIRTNTLANRSRVNFVISAWLYVIRCTEQIFVMIMQYLHCQKFSLTVVATIKCEIIFVIWKIYHGPLKKLLTDMFLLKHLTNVLGFFGSILLILNFFTRILNNQDHFLCIM